MVSVKREQKIFFFKVPFNFLIYNDSLYFTFKGKIDLNLSIKMKQWSKQHLFLALAPLVRPALNQAHVPSLVLLITILVTHLTALICAQVWAFFLLLLFLLLLHNRLYLEYRACLLDCPADEHINIPKNIKADTFLTCCQYQS